MRKRFIAEGSSPGGPDLLGYFFSPVSLNQGEVVLALEFEPETRSVAEITAKPDRCLSGNRPPAIQDVRDAARWYTKSER